MAIIVSTAILLLFWTPGVRLLRLWRQTAKAPEGWLAGFFLCLGLGSALGLYSLGRQGEANFLAQRMGAVTMQCSSMFCIAVFTRAVFRPSASWATAVCVTSVLVYLGGVTTMLAMGELGNQLHWTNELMTWWALMCVIWAFVECTIYFNRMRRQATMGLGDPVVRNRFLLWMIWTGAIVALPMMSISVKAYLVATTPEGEVVRATGGVLLFIRGLVASMGMTALVAIALSFFPPASYTAWVKGRSAEESA